MLYNPLDKFYKSQTGAVKEGLLTFRVTGDFKNCVLVLCSDFSDQIFRYQMKSFNGFFECTIETKVGLYWYFFDTLDGHYIGKNDDNVGTLSKTPSSFQLSVYSKDYKVPNGLYGGVIYQIFPDRFCRSSDAKKILNNRYYHENTNDQPHYKPNKYGKVENIDFFGGDFKGIASKLEYLKSLSVTHIYLNPIFKANSNHRYDTGDYFEFDELLGTKEDFLNLIKEANNYNIKIILDGVFNHTGDDSLYFNKYGKYDSLGAYQSKHSKYSDWYLFSEFPNKYKSWWGITTLPTTNKSCQDFIDFITGENGVLDYYLKTGIAGWRLDVVDELPEFFVNKIRERVKKSNPDAILIGEVWEDASNKIAYGVRRKYFLGKELDSVMNYPLKNAIINFVKNGDSKHLLRLIREQIDHYPKMVLDALMNVLSTHDTARLISAVSSVDIINKSKEELANLYISNNEYKLAKFRLKAASLLQFTLYGVPSLYYGDEAGMQGFIDPINRKFYPWGNEDHELIDWYKFLGKLRKDNKLFIDGEFKEIYLDDGIFIFSRYNKKDEIVICVNVSQYEKILQICGEVYDLISGEKVSGVHKVLPYSLSVYINLA